MQRYKIKIEYEGTPFVGWQFQKNGQSVQEVLQKAIFNFSKEKVVVTGAGRTDSGVHALAQVAHFDLKKKIKRKSLLPAINQNIGNKLVTVLKINKTNKKFHARFDAKKRTYQYIIINRQSPLVLEKNKAWHIRKKLDIKVMKKGAKLLLGTHDFSTFRASSCGAKSPIKTMEKILIKKNKDKIILKFISKSFLQQQVRSMVGCIKYLGEGKWNMDTFKESFKSKKRIKCAPPAPSCGLYLKNISY
ncbi:tRNA pseudouridine(38-40) synthase TruA [Pelagibacteraceae bacterium]|nr:tRNA pseudouridine(38-40) synthase TruA [Pelagibacteraceae bacterium]